MRLVEYLFEENITQISFADRVGISSVHLGEILRGRRPGVKLAVRIEEATNGKVTKEELLFPDDYLNK